MDPRQFVDTRMKRCMAQTLEELEERVEKPLQQLFDGTSNGVTHRQLGTILDGVGETKRTFRKRLQTFAGDCADMMPTDIEINGYEPVIRR